MRWLVGCCLLLGLIHCKEDDQTIDTTIERMGEYHSPSILIPIFVRNKAHALPYFLGGIEELNYPKSRIRIWFVTDHNEDDSLEMLKHWMKVWETSYNEIRLEIRDPRKGEYDDTETVLSWSPKRYAHTLKLKQEALNKARKMWVDYVFFIDADNIITHQELLSVLIKRNKLVVGPMLETGVAFSNFWSGQNDETGYYERGDDYYDIREYRNISVHQVPMLHSCYLIDMNRWKSDKIQFWPRLDRYAKELPEWPLDDNIYFSGMMRLLNLELFVDNSLWAGWFPYPVQSGILQNEIDMFVYTIMEINTEPPVGWNILPPASYAVPAVFPPATKLEQFGIGDIFVINLERRKDRYHRMDYNMRLLGLDYTYFPAVDGKKLTQLEIDQMGIRQLPGFSDPHHPRTITRGEVGCFLSHYRIWEESMDHEMVIVLEDDVRFKPYFIRELHYLLKEAKTLEHWDLIYLGRKRGPGAQDDVERKVTERITTATYSYWTIGYILKGSAARTLVEERPLEKLVPVDEYLPIMYGAHKESKYARHFKHKTLKAFSAEPVLLTPTHYTGQQNYITDTEPDNEEDILFKDEL